MNHVIEARSEAAGFTLEGGGSLVDGAPMHDTVWGQGVDIGGAPAAEYRCGTAGARHDSVGGGTGAMHDTVGGGTGAEGATATYAEAASESSSTRRAVRNDTGGELPLTYRIPGGGAPARAGDEVEVGLYVAVGTLSLLTGGATGPDNASAEWAGRSIRPSPPAALVVKGLHVTLAARWVFYAELKSKTQSGLDPVSPGELRSIDVMEPPEALERGDGAIARALRGLLCPVAASGPQPLAEAGEESEPT